MKEKSHYKNRQYVRFTPESGHGRCKNAAIVAGDELGKIVFSGAKVRKLSMHTHLVPLAAFCSYSLPRRPKIIAHSRHSHELIK
jgi:hypothetical protein